jgi:hypothetical protein
MLNTAPAFPDAEKRSKQISQDINIDDELNIDPE